MPTQQATLFDFAKSQPAPEPAGTRAEPSNGEMPRQRPVVDARVIEAELEELTTARIKVKLNKHLAAATSIRETDEGYAVQLNPNKIRSTGKLDAQLDFCRQTVTRYQ